MTATHGEMDDDEIHMLKCGCERRVAQRGGSVESTGGPLCSCTDGCSLLDRSCHVDVGTWLFERLRRRVLSVLPSCLLPAASFSSLSTQQRLSTCVDLWNTGPGHIGGGQSVTASADARSASARAANAPDFADTDKQCVGLLSCTSVIDDHDRDLAQA